MPAWNWAQSLETARQVKVFSGGACNIRDASGALLRNSERDKVNDWLTQRGVLFYDPQIHPDTHGCEYDCDVHHRLEQAARSAAGVNLFEVSPHTFCGVTSIEVAVEVFSLEKPTIIFFSDGHDDLDLMPAHSPDGYPLFVPKGLRDSQAAMRSHYNEMIKNANRMRQYLLLFAEQLGALDQYLDEGNELRQAICKLVHINVFMRVVFTQEAAIHALDNLLRYRNIQ